MVKVHETNVLVPLCALAALEELRAEHGISRDAMLRRLLTEHVERQQALPEADRLTHISTVLWYPPPPRHRGAESIAARLRLRIEPALSEAAREVSLRLPGQSPRRGPRDYQPRLLADAVVTAIACEREFSDDVLAGLLPLLRHRAAAGLWRLAVAATLTKAEKAVLRRTDQRSLDVAHFLDEDVAWHDERRREMVGHLAGQLLRGPDRLGHERMLYNQRVSGWGGLKDAFEAGGHSLLINAPRPLHGLEGRGGGAVWRAERRVEMRGLGHWVLKGRSDSRLVSPPGWTLRRPRSWRPAAIPIGGTFSPAVTALLAERRVVQLAVGSRQVVWPILSADRPVPGLEIALAEAGRLPPEEFVELLLLKPDPDHIGPVVVPVYIADRLGLVNAAIRHQLVAEAREETFHNMREVIDSHPDLRPSQRAALVAAMNAPARFNRLARAIGDKGAIVVRPVWRWDVTSLADEVIAGRDAEGLRWLTGTLLRMRKRALEQSMEDASRRAFQRTRPGWID